MTDLESLLNRRAELALEIAETEEALREIKNEMNNIIETEIPFTLRGMGLYSAKLSDGTEIKIEKAYNVKTLDAAKLAQWLEAHDAGSIIKTELVFSKGDFSPELRELLVTNGAEFSEASAVHPSTLKKFIREEYESTAELPPPEAVEVRVYEYAKIKEGKED